MKRIANGDTMPSLAVLGSQWGDEGKGKIIDYLDGDADLIVRFQGGNNAGHTIVVGDRVFKLHGLPSGVVRPGKLAVIGNGAVVNMEELLEEIRQVEENGGNVDGLRISDRAALIMNYHKKLDGAEEAYRGSKAVGTTKKGIGPAYQDKIARIGFRAGDLLEEETLKDKISLLLPYKKDLMKMMGTEVCCCTPESLLSKMEGWGEKLGKYICDTSVLVNDALDAGKNVMFEGAQGAMLDIDHGTYPYVTSSSTMAGGVCTGAGIAPKRLNKVMGVVKAYTTRVGEGPFVTELKGEDEKKLQQKGGEFGVTTGRGRRCGWLDLVVVNHANMLCGFDSLAVTKIDVLNDVDTIPVCYEYDIDGHRTRHYPASLQKLNAAKPIYKEFKGWKGWEDTEAVVKGGYDELPREMKDYISFIEEQTKVPADIISVGPERDQTICRRSDWWN
ncbi:MAG: adenylosuccinate synthase [Candidatus Methanomethylophilus sp.]|jgi:adenylosuccinate synthase|nr:adenylosuccinate synthase [Methanomethylophilus sp.]MCI2074098.1 adenylosuccinate synthase [Methanomethylophilus sp.]MCI2093105.1 adenylosuccinate synthase [Methanomethylophilus sp.]MEE3400935.1 adenylosuccinate synthase [Methanomethylophilus sp.]